MKTIRIIAALYIIVLLTFTAKVSAQDDFTKNYKQQFQVDENTLVDISNKYGDVVVKETNENLVSINVTITIKGEKKEKAAQYADNIVITLKKEGNTVFGQTELKDGFNNVNFKIDYEVLMPKQLNLNLENKYGSVFINELSGVVNLTIKYGNLTANKLLRGKTEPKSMVNVAYGKADIEECNWLKLDVSYSKIEIEHSQALMIVSKYSKIEIGESSSVVADSKYDTPFEIGTVNNFVCTGKYSKYSVGKLNKKLEIDAKYSKVEISEVASDFDEIKIDCGYGGADIGVNASSSYQLNADVEYGDISYPHNDRMSRQRDNTSIKVWGPVGNQSNPAAKINIICRYGNVNLGD